MGSRGLGIVLLVLVLLSSGQALPRPITIGAIFHSDEVEHYVAFNKALALLAREQIAPSFELQPSIKWVNVSNDSFKTGIAEICNVLRKRVERNLVLFSGLYVETNTLSHVDTRSSHKRHCFHDFLRSCNHRFRHTEDACELITEGVAAIFGPGNAHTRGIVSSTAAKFDIPHIEYSWRSVEESDPPPTTINIYPDSEKISQAIADAVEATNWNQYTAIYETNAGLARIQKALQNHGPKDNPITVRQLKNWLDKGKEPDYRPLLKEVANSSDYNIILDIEPEHLIAVLIQAKEVKLLHDYYSYIITGLHTSDVQLLNVLNGTNTNITIFQMIKDDSYQLNSVESACLFDSVFLFNEALEALEARNQNNEAPVTIEPEPLSCGDTQKYPAGLNITSIMRTIAKEGKSTGTMIFNEHGRRGFKLTLKETSKDLANVSGAWDDGKLTIITTEQERSLGIFKSFQDKQFIVTTKPGDPYVMEVTDGTTRGIQIGNKRYEGYCIDLIEAIADELDMKYKFEIVGDLQYGSFNKETKQWNGLIRRLLDHEADLAICDLTITKERESAVDFTMPFMNLGISILFAKPEEKVPELFSFLSPFSTDVWMYMATAFVAVSIMLFALARMAPGEWVSAHPCASEPEELENSFNLMNSFWLTIGSLMQQGSDILPRAPSIRMVAGMWWFFTLIMVSSYTANLAAFLASTKQDVSIDDVDQLAQQTKIKYGAVKGGSTAGYFKGSNVTNYQRMWATMSESRPSTLTGTNQEGVDRVLKSKRSYAFLMESTGIEYAEKKNCSLMQVGGLLDNKGYGIATPPNSPYRTRISETILKLQERGDLRELKQKWWSYGAQNCTVTNKSGGDGELGMNNVGGVFLVLLFGVIGAIIMAIFEFIWNVKKVAVEEKITPREALIAELTFLVKFWLKTKPVKVAQSIQSSSTGEGGFGRAASAPRSIIGSFNRLNMLDKFDKDDNSPNNRSNNHKIS